MECGAGWGRRYQPHRPLARARAALRAAARRQVDPGERGRAIGHCRSSVFGRQRVSLGTIRKPKQPNGRDRVPMKLADLLTVDAVSEARFAALDLAGVSADSRTIKPGDLFVAVAGAKDDGLDFVSQAVASGAAAVMAERPPATPLPQGGAFLTVDHAPPALALPAAEVFSRPPPGGG